MGSTRFRGRSTRIGWIPLVALGVLAGVAPWPSAAGASVGCTPGAVEQPYLAWRDARHYALAPGGSFEDGAAGWSLTGGAQLEAPGAWFVPASSQVSLYLPPGSAATSAPICVGRRDAVARMFARSGGGALSAMLRVQVLRTRSGAAAAHAVGDVSAAPAWRVTRRLATCVGAASWIRYRLAPAGNAAVSIDDLYVDPWAKW